MIFLSCFVYSFGFHAYKSKSTVHAVNDKLYTRDLRKKFEGHKLSTRYVLHGIFSPKSLTAFILPPVEGQNVRINYTSDCSCMFVPIIVIVV